MSNSNEATPICADTGCICRWARSIGDDELLVAFACVQREVFERVGINRETFTEKMNQVMDPVVNEYQAQIRDHFGVKEES